MSMVVTPSDNISLSVVLSISVMWLYLGYGWSLETHLGLTPSQEGGRKAWELLLSSFLPWGYIKSKQLPGDHLGGQIFHELSGCRLCSSVD